MEEHQDGQEAEDRREEVWPGAFIGFSKGKNKAGQGKHVRIGLFEKF